MFFAVALAEGAVRLLGLESRQGQLVADIDVEGEGRELWWGPSPSQDPDRDGLREVGLKAAPEGAPRVVLLGDSIIYGAGIPPEARLGARLSEDFEVVDAAVPGFSTTQERIALSRALEKGAPDAIVLGFFQNDHAQWRRAGGGVIDSCERISLLGWSVPGPWHLSAMSHSALYRLIAAGPRRYDRACQGRGEEAVLRELEEIISRTARLRAELILLLLPPTEIDGEDASAWDQVRIRVRKNELYNQVRELFAGRPHVRVLDASEPLRDAAFGDMVIDRGGHLSAEAHQRIATWLRAYLPGGSEDPGPPGEGGLRRRREPHPSVPGASPLGERPDPRREPRPASPLPSP